MTPSGRGREVLSILNCVRRIHRDGEGEGEGEGGGDFLLLTSLHGFFKFMQSHDSL